MRSLSLARAAVILSLAMPWSPPVHPQGQGGNVRCSIGTAPLIAFGEYDTESNMARHTNGELRFNCQPNKTMTVRVDIGPSGVSGSISDRRMRGSGADELGYNLFQDARGTILWGDGVRGGVPAFVTGKDEFRVQIHGVIPARQQVVEGLYSDSVRITILP